MRNIIGVDYLTTTGELIDPPQTALIIVELCRLNFVSSFPLAFYKGVKKKKPVSQVVPSFITLQPFLFIKISYEKTYIFNSFFRKKKYVYDAISYEEGDENSR